MGTPFIAHLTPSQLSDQTYDCTKSWSEQSPSIPKTFVDAMEVREQVFVKEQGVPLEFEHDKDDARSNHFVIYASVRKVVEPALVDPVTGDIIRPRRSETRSTPIGTIRLIPFPHTPHPQAGGRYVDNVLQNVEVNRLTASQEKRITSDLPYGRDPPTSLHDGTEPYIKIGRLAIVKEFRGHRMSSQLWANAREWLVSHPYYYNPSVQRNGLAALGVKGADDIPHWRGLVCVHAQLSAVPLWKKWGFEVDEKMGEWWEEDIPHVGMFQRLKLDDVPIEVRSS